MSGLYTRREYFGLLGAAAILPLRSSAATTKNMRGIFIIMATPFSKSKEVEYDELQAEVDYLVRCGVHGMVWPQSVSEYTSLTKSERFLGMEILAKAAKGKRLALVLGVQGRNTEEALEYARHAEKLSPDAVIAIPPEDGKSPADIETYYRTLARVVDRPFFVQCPEAGPKMSVDLLLKLARDFPQLGYVKQEEAPVIGRMQELAGHRDVMKGIFSGNAGITMLYEMRLGFDGTMPGAPYADIYAQIWELYQSGQADKARDLFGKLLLMLNLNQPIPRTRHYIMKKRGIFKTMVSRQTDAEMTPQQIQEVDFNFAALQPYLRA